MVKILGGLLLCLFLDYSFVLSVWTDFDLVRPFKAWGSQGITPYIKISGIASKKAVNGSQFGISISNIGDLNHDGFVDLAVGAIGEGERVKNRNFSTFASGSVKSHRRIGGYFNGGPILLSNDRFGYSICKWTNHVIAVGAPGTYLGTVYLLHLHSNGTLQKYQMLRGGFGQGPPSSYGSGFGSALANMGDMDGDGVPELAVGAGSEFGGEQRVYILFMFSNGTVKHYSTIASGIGGGPLLLPYSFFGSSLANIGDVNRDGITDIAIGARWTRDLVTGSQMGAVYLCTLQANGTASQCLHYNSANLPLETNDNCGASLTTIGDLNRDDLRARHADLAHIPPRPQIPDLLIGCPQGPTGVPTGRILVLFMSDGGYLKQVATVPSRSLYFPKLPSRGRYGSAVCNYTDIDKNGINEMIIGAPGDNDGDGALYVLFLRRRRYHAAPFDFIAFLLKIVIPIGVTVCAVFIACVAFCYYFRRKPTEIELAVKAAGVETGLERKRVKHKKASDDPNMRDKKTRYADHYYE